MHLRVSVFALAAAAVALTPAAAQTANGSKPPADPDKKICKREVATGSVMAKVTCHTKAEWDALAARGQSDMDRTLSQQRSRDMVGSTRELNRMN
jgi:Spy/CpxP family protein refolding chaperone